MLYRSPTIINNGYFIMKKILLTTALIASISTPALAEITENTFYLRGDLGAAAFNKNHASKTATIPALDLGIGYNITDRIRTELVLNVPFIKDPKKKAAAQANAGQMTVKTLTEHSTNVTALLARISADVIDLGTAKIFLTGGLGVSSIQEHNTVTTSDGTTIRSRNTTTVNGTVIRNTATAETRRHETKTTTHLIKLT